MQNRTHTCNELRLEHVGQKVKISGWMENVREVGGRLAFIVLRDFYGTTQIVVEDPEILRIVTGLNKESVISISGTVRERSSKNPKIATGEIEVVPDSVEILGRNRYNALPFQVTRSREADEAIRLKYRYLDLRNPAVKQNIVLRCNVVAALRQAMTEHGFLEITTPILTASSPEGARDYLVPARKHPGKFYALPQAPQQFKQLLMVSGFDRYFQIAKCFRDEDLRADRQPEFTQIDCEMSFADQEDVLEIFEGLARHLFREVRGVELPPLQRMTWHEAMRRFGSDKPDLRFGMELVELMPQLKGTGTFPVFNEAEYIGAICVPGCANYTRKQLDQLTDFVKRPQVGAKGLVYVKFNEDGTVKSSADKFYDPEVWQQVKEACGANDGDLVLILCGDNANKTRIQLCTLRLEMGDRLGLRDKDRFVCLWIVDFPLFEWSDEEQRLMATHHPFTLPNPDDIPLLDTAPEKVRAVAYDFVCNGVEVGGDCAVADDMRTESNHHAGSD